MSERLAEMVRGIRNPYCDDSPEGIVYEAALKAAADLIANSPELAAREKERSELLAVVYAAEELRQGRITQNELFKVLAVALDAAQLGE